MSITEHGVVGARGGAYADRRWTAHMSARRVRRMIGYRTWRRYKRIAVIRNPYDRLVSMFWWRQSETRRAELAAGTFAEVQDAFAAWIRTARISKNVSKLRTGPRYCLTHVLYYERLETDVAALFSLLGEAPIALPRYKSGARLRPEPFQDYYDDALEKLVESRCGFELAFFGYDLQGGPYTASKATRAMRLATLDPARITNFLRTPKSPLEFAPEPLDHSCGQA